MRTVYEGGFETLKPLQVVGMDMAEETSNRRGVQGAQTEMINADSGKFGNDSIKCRHDGMLEASNKVFFSGVLEYP